MVICITQNGVRRCYHIPRFRVPLETSPSAPTDPQSSLLIDATLVATITDLAGRLSDPRVAEALHSGIATAIRTMQAHAGEGVELHLDPPQN